MTFNTWQSWGIKQRVVLVSLLPAMVLFLSMILYLYHSRLVEVEQETADRGRILASSLAASSEYGVISGNIGELRHLANGLLRVDKSIQRIQILDADKQRLVEVDSPTLKGRDAKVFEAAIRKSPINVDLFDGIGQPHITATEGSVPEATQDTVLGYVQVAMSPAFMMAKKREQIVVGSLIASAAMAFSVILGLYLALSLTRPLSSTINALRRIRGGNYDVQLDTTAVGEIGELQSTIVEMSDDLKQFKEDLESKVVARTRDLEEARNQALKAHTENRRLIQKVHSAVEEERENISIEIHDHLNASLIVAKLSAQQIVDLTKKCPPGHPREEIKLRAQSIIDLTAELYQLARGIVKRLRPEIIDTLGLQGAVEEMVRNYDGLHPDCQFIFESEGGFSDLSNELAISAYRLVQEALSNVVKHAAATRARVRLERQNDGLIIEVEDNGKGFDPETVVLGVGLIGMRERAVSSGGELKISSEIKTGTTIFARLLY